MIEKLPLFFLTAASCVVTLLAQRSAGAVVGVSELPLSLRLENALVSYVAYIGKVIWPSGLSVFYTPRWESLAWPEVIASAVILASLTTAVLYFQPARYLATGWFFFLITLIPVIGIVQVGHQAMADRYTYVPAIGLFLVAVWSGSRVVHDVAIPRLIPAVTALCLLLALVATTRRYLSCWQNGVDLFTHARAVAGPPDFFIEEGLAENLASFGQSGNALRHYREACRLRPNFDRCHYKMAEILWQRGELQDALAEFELVGSYADRKEIALLGLINAGKILLEMGAYRQAELKFTAAVELDPDNNEVLQLQRAAHEKNETAP